jgi:hypothetical protein
VHDLPDLAGGVSAVTVTHHVEHTAARSLLLPD